MKYSFSAFLLGLICCLLPFHADTSALRGFNTNAFLYNFPGQKFTEEYLDTLNKLSPQILRFPGGTIANKYHFSKSGYGQNSNFDKMTDQNYIVEFCRLVKSMDRPPQVLFVVNMFEHFYKPTRSDWDLLVENLAAILYLKKQGIKIVGVELGNEFYLYPVIRGWNIKISKETIVRLKQDSDDSWWPVTFKKYNRLAKLYQAAIQKIDPNISIGIPMGSSTNKNHRKWNAFAAQMTFTDAYVQHWYGQLGNAKTEQAALKQFDIFTKRVQKNITQLQQTHKQIWITEWNGIDFGFKNDRNTRWKQSPLHVQLNQRLQQLFDQLGVKITVYHRISSGKEGNTYNLINVDRGHISVNKTYWEFLKPPLKNN